ncbi:hypothetical protein RJ639_001169 [Escallonia herrerae]|uniref:60S ribosomal protein L41 n=1 Tax=Escallonia herrerae TaxID=1293975 RepID=A0AA88XB02_9ASTE|nr:hypothetical protein RJ639_001169 [Escallonia herrerae]
MRAKWKKKRMRRLKRKRRKMRQRSNLGVTYQHLYFESQTFWYKYVGGILIWKACLECYHSVQIDVLLVIRGPVPTHFHSFEKAVYGPDPSKLYGSLELPESTATISTNGTPADMS